MANRDKTAKELAIENHDTIHDNLGKVQDILTSSLAGDSWDRITAIGMAGKLLDICREDITTSKESVQDVKEEKQNGT